MALAARKRKARKRLDNSVSVACDTGVFRGLRRSPASRFASFHRNVLRCRNEGCVRWNDEVVEGKRERKRGTTTHVTSVRSYIQWRALFTASKRRWMYPVANGKMYPIEWFFLPLSAIQREAKFKGSDIGEPKRNVILKLAILLLYVFLNIKRNI